MLLAILRNFFVLECLDCKFTVKLQLILSAKLYYKLIKISWATKKFRWANRSFQGVRVRLLNERGFMQKKKSHIEINNILSIYFYNTRTFISWASRKTKISHVICFSSTLEVGSRGSLGGILNTNIALVILIFFKKTQALSKFEKSYCKQLLLWLLLLLHLKLQFTMKICAAPMI